MPQSWPLTKTRAFTMTSPRSSTLEEEVSFLAVHSTLHLLGYDHETSQEDEDEMFGIQKEIVNAIRTGELE